MLPCVILAGGLGTRMRSVTAAAPKLLVPVLGRPFVDHQLAWLSDQRVAAVVLSIGHLGAAIRDHVADGSKWKIPVTYVDEGERLRGTAGALRLALEQDMLPEAFLLVYGDSYVPIDLGPVQRAFEDSTLPALMTVHRNEDRWERSNARYDDGRVTLYQKAHPDPAGAGLRFVDYGVSVIRRAVVADLVPAGMPADLADVFHQLSVEGRLAGFEVHDRFFEVGSPAGLRDLEAHLAGTASPVRRDPPSSDAVV